MVTVLPLCCLFLSKSSRKLFVTELRVLSVHPNAILVVQAEHCCDVRLAEILQLKDVEPTRTVGYWPTTLQYLLEFCILSPDCIGAAGNHIPPIYYRVFLAI